MSCILWFFGLSKVFLTSHLFSLFFFFINLKLCLFEFFTGDVVGAGKFVFLGFSLFFWSWSGSVLLLKFFFGWTITCRSSKILDIANMGVLYVQRSIQTTYVWRRDLMELMGDMLDSAMRRTNVAHWREIGARFVEWFELNNLFGY